MCDYLWSFLKRNIVCTYVKYNVVWIVFTNWWLHLILYATNLIFLKFLNRGKVIIYQVVMQINVFCIFWVFNVVDFALENISVLFKPEFLCYHCCPNGIELQSLDFNLWTSGLSMNILGAGDKSPVQRGFFTNSGFWVRCIIFVIL